MFLAPVEPKKAKTSRCSAAEITSQLRKKGGGGRAGGPMGSTGE